ncbi:hypothetical protein T484DRAFT_3297215 [Baffinella frigidus]|nr:hypothetical protein T484DRAFT_3297215 [Cryptophyta sp. CCMP2293]
MDLPLDLGGHVSVLVSVQGMYSVQEQEVHRALSRTPPHLTTQTPAPHRSRRTVAPFPELEPEHEPEPEAGAEGSLASKARTTLTEGRVGWRGQVLDWLGQDANEFPMLVKCGVRSRRDLEELAHSEILGRMANANLGEASREVVAARIYAAKKGAGFVSGLTRQLAARINRFYSAPALPGGVPRSKVPQVSRWAGEMFARSLETDDVEPGASRDASLVSQTSEALLA